MRSFLHFLCCFPRKISTDSLTLDTDDEDDLQCDEKKPTCTNCSNHEIECSFSNNAPVTPASDSHSPITTISEPSPEQIKTRSSQRYVPYHFSAGGVQQTFKLAKPKRKPEITSHSTGTQCDPPPLENISFSDLQLFHHYTISTYRTMNDDNDENGVWQNHLVQWGMEFPSIMHLILALSALHLAHEQPTVRDYYVQKADDHFTFGVRSVTGVLAQLNANNCQKIYMAAVLVCFIYFGRGPRPGEYLIFSDSGPAEWKVLMGGVKMILASHHNRVFSGVLKPTGDARERLLSSSMRLALNEHTVRVQMLERLVEQHGDPSAREMYAAAIENLLEIMIEVYEQRSMGDAGVALMHLLIGWIYRLPDELVSLLELKDPCALVILAYWALLLKYMESTWFMVGWSQHVLSGIMASLPPEFGSWIEWPLTKVQT
ncbi:hypothetical protein N7462_004316 [Penicillium macrosclerotiorum]|uniref:uncharacterized protein n=1 Tax=Penicillium macrosclerotiorum TaxID=303699 RepID=UPI002547C1D9|nr:uncharacterized protein N7462_004316 [Penicillium macrosclerotiorum]KAJ5689924.1 hypothetical protein N7462_004316 [Penicillium macrosclerotiorum]